VYAPGGRSEKEKFPSASVLKVRVIPFSALFKVTFALATRAPVESETEPENVALEAAVWALVTGTAMLNASAATAKNRERLRNLGIDKGPLSCGVQKEVIGNCTELANSSAKVLGVVKLFLKSTAESANVRVPQPWMREALSY